MCITAPHLGGEEYVSINTRTYVPVGYLWKGSQGLQTTAVFGEGSRWLWDGEGGSLGFFTVHFVVL